MKVCPVCGKKYSDTSTLCSADAAVLQRTEDPLIGQKLAGKYLVEKLIKSGGMGSVYLGKHILMDKTVAIKVLRPSLALDTDVVARFSREAKAASRISHPHAVSVTDFGEDENGVVFLVMEYLDGRTLKEVIKTEGPMAVPRAVEIIRQVSGALDAAHEQGVVHRDLKSDNIMLTRTNGGEWAKVLDFGIAKIQQPPGFRDIDLTAPNLVIGTPQYMSPEQCSQSGPIDARSDVYSLGVIVYEMLAGHVPFTGESPTVIMMKQVQDQPPSVQEARPQLGAEVDGVLARALAKQPRDRFQSAGELSGALADAASRLSEPSLVAAAPITTPISPVAAAAVNDDEDEVTVVRATPIAAPNDESTVVRTRREVPIAPPPEGPGSSGIWRIMIPGVIVLVAVFGIIYFLTRGSSQTPLPTDNTNASEPGLVQAPNSQPVQAAGTPTGENERDIHSLPTATPTPRVAGANANVTEIPPATVIGNFGSNENSNSNRNRNANQKATPRVSPEGEAPPLPKPSATVKTVPKPVASPTGNP